METERALKDVVNGMVKEFGRFAMFVENVLSQHLYCSLTSAGLALLKDIVAGCHVAARSLF